VTLFNAKPSQAGELIQATPFASGRANNGQRRPNTVPGVGFSARETRSMRGRKESLEQAMGTAATYLDWHAQQDRDSRRRLRPHQAVQRGRSEAAAGTRCQPFEAEVEEPSAGGEGWDKTGSGVGRALEMQKLCGIIERAANSRHPVLILGESGTGKEMVARFIHYSGPFRDKPFIPIDCGSVVPALIECALFGYVKGAFRSTKRSHDRLTAVAEGGTVFLDEVGELPADLQAELLRTIQENEICTVGTTSRVPMNVRILAATNCDLEQAVMHGTFRRDLYFRLNLVSLRIPGLRERRQDIPSLIAHFLERIVRDSGQGKILSEEALKALLAYDWPGNLRELENCLERTCAFSSGPLIHTTDLPPEIANLPRPQASNGNGHAGKIISMAELEKQAILSAIAELNGDKLKAARLLGIGKTTLYRKLKDYVLQGQPYSIGLGHLGVHD
jgi:DNA-binding NtrC family response regulator